MRKIILNTGAEYKINRCGASAGVLWIGFPADTLNMVQAATFFSDAEATKKIISTFDFDGMETVFEGYTSLIHLQEESDGTLLLALKKQAISTDAKGE